MRQKRAKAYKRLMQTYSLTFGFRQPYQVLVDADFCQTITKAQVDVEKMLETVCQGKCKPMITQCSMQVLYDLGREAQEVVDLAKRFERRKCNHREPIPNDACLTDVIGPDNKHRYVLATQSVPLRNHMRSSVPALPVMHIKRGVTVLEPMSDVSVRRKAQLEQSALQEAKAAALPAPPTSLVVDIVGAEVDDEAEAAPKAAETPKPKKKGPKGPNPLSQKKKKPEKVAPGGASKGKGPATAGGAKKEGGAAGAAGSKRKRSADDEATPSAAAVATELKLDVVGAAGAASEGEGRKRKKRRRRTGKVSGAVNGAGGEGSGADSGGDD